MKGECDVLKEREKARDQECEELRFKCETTMTEFDKNPAMIMLCKKIASLLGEIKEHNSKVVSKVVPYVATDLVLSDDMGKLVAKLVSSTIIYRRFQAFEEVANMKDPFDITKVKDPYASVEALLSMKPRILQRLVQQGPMFLPPLLLLRRPLCHLF
ncbi:hypothetical protein Tco_0099439 [Tanacetum coccineum]